MNQTDYDKTKFTTDEYGNLIPRPKRRKTKHTCEFCRKLGETTCGNDTEGFACFEGR